MHIELYLAERGRMLADEIQHLAHIDETSRFIFNVSTVARPVGVKPIICVWSSFQQKWSYHLVRRGLYNGTRVLSVGSGASVLFYLGPLHPEHEKA
jgi:hypothetical protein